MASHHISPGKKQWTWGHSDFGKAWDKNLTDEDGPYIELMTGVFTDNQPDFSWLMPYEEKSFTQYFLPYRELGLVKNASKDLLINIEKIEEQLVVKIFATSAQKENTVIVMSEGNLLWEENFDITPDKVYVQSIPVNANVTEENMLLIITDCNSKEMLRYETGDKKLNEIPAPAKAALPPADVENNEQLFLTGLHLEQYRHATYSPVPYYEEALRRDPADVRNNNALGVWYLRRGQFIKSETYFRKAIETVTQRNPNPYDSEPYYNLGLCLKAQGRIEEAYDAFYKSCWSSTWQDSGYFSLAQIDLAKKDFEKALEHIVWSLDRNARNSKAYVLKIAALRKLNRFDEALFNCKISLERDTFNLAVYFEQHQVFLLLNDKDAAEKSLKKLKSSARGFVQNYIEYALDYAAAGLFEEAIAFLQLYIRENPVSVYPMLWYCLGYWHHQCNDNIHAKKYFEKGAAANQDLCFSNRLEDISILQLATSYNNADAKAPYYLGNLWYDKRQYAEAIEQWELSAQRDQNFPTVFRNLGLAYFNKSKDEKKSLDCYEKSFALNTKDARVLMEMDQLHKRMNKNVHDRLAFLEQHLPVVEWRDDLYLERVALINFLGDYSKAYQLLLQRKFHPWEGGEGKVSDQYCYSLVEMAKENIRSAQYEKAIEWLNKAQVYPGNLGEGKLSGTCENDIFYWLGIAFEKLGQSQKAVHYFKMATAGLSEPSAAMFYNDQQPDKIFYQGLAWNKLAEPEKAKQIFNCLVEYGQTHLDDKIKIDYFAVSLPNMLVFDDDLDLRNHVHCLYIMALGYFGLNRYGEATACFEKVLAKDRMHLGARSHLGFDQSI